MARSLRRSVDELIQERGFRLRGPLLRRMEKTLRSDFSDVVVHVSALSCALNKCFGAQAFTVRNHICFSERTFDPNSDFGQNLLAHELTHVIQKRLGNDGIGRKRAPSASELEIEAEAAALLLQQDEGSFPVTADPTDLPRFWGPEGHYYTVYLMALAVDDLPATLTELRGKGVRLLGDPGPDKPVSGQVFVHPGSANGVLTQLVQR